MSSNRLSFSRNQLRTFQKYMHAKPELRKIELDLIKKAQKYMKYIAWIPGLKMVAIGNSVALWHATEESDMDLFIITDQNSLWLVRIFVTGIFQVLWVRKTTKNHAGRFCLSFFVTIQWMDFSHFALKNDIYLYFRCVYLRPIIDYENTYQEFLPSQSWADFGEYWQEISIHQKEYVVYEWNGKKENFFSRLLNRFFRWLFLSRTLRSFEKLGKPDGVKIGENILKFHDEDRRKEIADAWHKYSSSHV